MKPDDLDDEPNTGSGDPTHRTPQVPEEPVNTGSGDPAHTPGPSTARG